MLPSSRCLGVSLFSSFGGFVFARSIVKPPFIPYFLFRVFSNYCCFRFETIHTCFLPPFQTFRFINMSISIVFTLSFCVANGCHIYQDHNLVPLCISIILVSMHWYALGGCCITPVENYFLGEPLNNHPYVLLHVSHQLNIPINTVNTLATLVPILLIISIATC